MKRKTRLLTEGALIAALYTALTLLSAAVGLSGTNAIQFRISEALCVLPAFTPAAVPGLFAGCLIANLLSPGISPWDVLFGSLATLIGALIAYFLRRHPLLVPIPTVLANTLIVPWVLIYAYGIPGGFWIQALWVLLGEAACCMVLGYPLMFALRRHRDRIFR